MTAAAGKWTWPTARRAVETLGEQHERCDDGEHRRGNDVGRVAAEQPQHQGESQEQQPQPLQPGFFCLDVHEERQQAGQDHHVEERPPGSAGGEHEGNYCEEQREHRHVRVLKPVPVVLDVAEERREEDQERRDPRPEDPSHALSRDAEHRPSCLA